VANTENIRIRVPAELKADWDRMLEERKLSQQDAALALFRWIVSEEPMVQLMIFGQAPASDRAQLTRVVLERLNGKGKRSGK
jgi:hypothetical protein